MFKKSADMSLEKLGESKKGKGKCCKGKRKGKWLEKMSLVPRISTWHMIQLMLKVIWNQKYLKMKNAVFAITSPVEVHLSISVIFTKWVKCDNRKCLHWTHGKYFSLFHHGLLI